MADKKHREVKHEKGERPLFASIIYLLAWVGGVLFIILAMFRSALDYKIVFVC